MDKEIVCSCPKCNSDVTEGRFSYECECGFKCGKEIWGVLVTNEMIKTICDGGKTDMFTFVKPDKEWSARLKYSADEEKVVFDFDAPKKDVLGTCPCCNGEVKVTKDYYICENYKKSCNLILGKDVRGHALTREEAKKLLNKETLPATEFTWNSGKKSTVPFKLNDEGRIEYLFENK